MFRHKLVTILTIIVMLFSFVPSVHAQGPIDKDAGGAIGGFPPLTPQEQQYLAQKEKAAQKQWNETHQSKSNLINPNTQGIHKLFAGYSGEYVEIGDGQRMWCVPYSTAVAITVYTQWGQLTQTYITGLATDEGTNNETGTYEWRARSVLNQRLNSNFYIYSSATSASNLAFRIELDINSGYALLTATDTKYMPGWNGNEYGHSIAIYGYYDDGYGNVIAYYVDTAGSGDGYTGSYYNSVDVNTLFNWVTMTVPGSTDSQNVQVW